MFNLTKFPGKGVGFRNEPSGFYTYPVMITLTLVFMLCQHE